MSRDPDVTELLYAIRVVAEDIGEIFANHIPANEWDAVQKPLLTYLRTLQRIGASSPEKIIVVGALKSLGFKDFSSLDKK
jgi:hypothetical protein